MNKKRYWQDTTTQPALIDQLRTGHAVAGTSDTVIGLLAPLTKKGFEILNAIKGRSDKPYLVLISDSQQAKQFTDAFIEEPLKSLAKHCWPGPLTIIVPAKKSIPSFLTSTEGAIALRVPDHPQLQAIAKQMNGLFSTSANRMGHPTPHTITALDQHIAQNVSLIIDDQRPRENKPSTILDCTNKKIKIIREGAYPISQLRKYVEI